MAQLCKPTAYRVRLFSAHDDLLDDLFFEKDTAAFELEEVIADKETGGMTLLLPGNLPEGFFAWDNRLELWRSICGGEWEIDGDQAWLISERRRVWKDGAYMWLITALSGNWILKRRIVAHKDKSAQADKTQQCPDDMMKNVVREQMVTGTDFFGTKTERIVSGLTVDANTSSVTPKIDKQFSTKVVFDVLREISDAANEGGTWLSFDTIWTGSNFAFKVYVGQRGVDLSESVRISPDQGAIESGELITSFIDAPSVVYAGGKGEGLARIISTPVVDANLVGASKYGWVEHFHDTKQSDTLQKVNDEAKAAAKRMKPKRTLSLKLNDGVGATYGRDYRFGDIIGVVWDGTLIGARVDGVRISLKQGKEEITVTLNEVSTDFQIAGTIPTGRGTVQQAPKQLTHILKTINAIQVPLDQRVGWTTPSFANSWVNVGTPYHDAQYAVDASGAVVLRGQVKDGTLNTAAFTLPADLRPSSRLAFLALSNGGVGRVNVHSDGTVVPEINSNVSYTLDNIRTWRNNLAWTNIPTPLSNSWANFGAPFFDAAYTVDENGHTRIRGVVRNGTIGSPIGALPTELRPAKVVSIATISNNAIGRIDISTLGNIIPVIGSNAFYMLDGLYIPNPNLIWNAVAFTNSWVNYGAPFFDAEYAQDGLGYVHLRGVIKNGTLNTAAFTLPPQLRPLRTIDVATISNNALGNITINSDGQVIPATNSNAFYFLDGIKFLPGQ